jgi:hypothetical protein
MSYKRCPFCDCLLDVDWSRAHAPHCPLVGIREEREVPC